jgi:DNA-binding transcriptional regulator YbjK
VAAGGRAHQARAQARRNALLRATVEVAAQRGVAGVTHRAVTERAGVPLATVSYFFESIADLAAEAIRTYTAADVAMLSALAGELAQLERSPDEIAAAFALAVAPRWPDTMAMFEAYLSAARSSDVRDAVAEALSTVRHVAAVAARAAGAPDPDAIANALVALAHGFALHQLAVPGSVDADDVRRAARTMLLGHLVETGHARLATRLARSG